MMRNNFVKYLFITLFALFFSLGANAQDTGDKYYKIGVSLMKKGDRAGAKQAFERAKMASSSKDMQNKCNAMIAKCSGKSEKKDDSDSHKKKEAEPKVIVRTKYITNEQQAYTKPIDRFAEEKKAKREAAEQEAARKEQSKPKEVEVEYITFATEEPGFEQIVSTQPTEAAMEVPANMYFDPIGLEFDAKAEKRESVRITSSRDDWVIISKPDWLSIDKNSSGIIVKAETYKDKNQDRSEKIVFSSGGKTFTLSVFQTKKKKNFFDKAKESFGIE